MSNDTQMQTPGGMAMPMTEQEVAFLQELRETTFYRTLQELLAAMGGHASMPIVKEEPAAPQRKTSPAERALEHEPVISWRTAADWAAYRARMDNGALAAFFVQQTEDSALSESAQKTARACRKKIELYKRDIGRIAAPPIEDGVIDEDDTGDVLYSIAGVVRDRLAPLYDDCRNGARNAQAIMEDRVFYNRALQIIDAYLRNLNFVPLAVADGMRIDGYEVYFDPIPVETDDAEKIGRFSAIGFPPYVAHYGDDQHDIVCINGRCIIWTPRRA